MLISLLLSAGSSVIVIVGVVIWLVSVILKTKKNAKTFTRVQPQNVDMSQDAEEAFVAPDVQQQSFIKAKKQKHKRDNNMSTPSEEGVRSTCGNDNADPIIASEIDMPSSEYSLENPDDAKRAIIYSEIFKPKF